MGVQHLWPILDSTVKTVHLNAIADKRVCIDVSCWLVEFQRAMNGSVPVHDKPHLRGLFHRLRCLVALNCRILGVLDGNISQLKKPTVAARMASAHQKGRTPFQRLQPAGHDDVRYAGGASVKRPKNSQFGRMALEAQKLLEAFGVPTITSPEEAEAQCAALNAAGLFDAVISSDNDALLFGAQTVYRRLTIGTKDDGIVEVCTMKNIQEDLQYGRNCLIALGVLLGSDYSPGLPNVGPAKAQQVVKSLGEERVLEVLQKEGLPALLAAARKKRPTKMGAPVIAENSTPMDEVGALAAMKAFLNPVVHPPDSEVVLRALEGERRPDVEALVQLCERWFEWPRDVTEGYIRPNLAARDLRKKALLEAQAARTTPPLPTQAERVQTVISPISHRVRRVVAQRVRNGKAHFEVEWDIDGPPLKNSVLEAETVRRSFPAKVLEYEAEKAAAKGKGRSGRGSAKQKKAVREERTPPKPAERPSDSARGESTGSALPVVVELSSDDDEDKELLEMVLPWARSLDREATTSAVETQKSEGSSESRVGAALHCGDDVRAVGEMLSSLELERATCTEAELRSKSSRSKVGEAGGHCGDGSSYDNCIDLT